jgi:hypothetical protein
LVNSTDAQRLNRYINENFISNPQDAKWHYYGWSNFAY